MSDVQEGFARGEETGRLGGYKIATTEERGTYTIYECAKFNSA
jgi:hypothetical protein